MIRLTRIQTPGPRRNCWPGAIASMLMIAVSGCRVGRTFHAPEVATDAAKVPYRVASALTDNTRITDQDQSVAAWWRTFNDEELNRLIGEVLTQNLTLEEARQRVLASVAVRRQVASERIPSVDGTAEAGQAATESDAINFRGPPAGQEMDYYSIGIASSWELDLWGRVGRLASAADADVQVAVEDYHDAAVAVAAELANAYIGCRAAEARLAILDRNIALLREVLRLAESELAAGTGSRLDVAQARRQLSATLALVPSLKAEVSSAENQVAVLLGHPPADGMISRGGLPQMPDVIGVGLPAQLLGRRADVRRATANYRAAFERIAAADAERYPTITLSGTLNVQSSDVGKLFGGDAYTYNLGPSLRWPIFDGGRIDEQVKQRMAQAAERRAAVERTLLGAIAEVENAAIGVVRTEERQADLAEATSAAREAVGHADTLYRAGSASLLQVIDAQRELVSLEDHEMQARRDALLAAVRLYRALGGGWEAMPLPDPSTAEVKPLSDKPLLGTSAPPGQATARKDDPQ